ncbi:MAG: metalloregulator ArsR/SmtB family transcription factor [Eubacteriaceae bacterium]|nr:metalloregulator ArsR/SmtB family transcription factor [Eubacteriaceae bacterium]
MDFDLSEFHQQKLALLFSMLGDSGRIKIISALSKGEMNVGAIVEEIGYTQSAVSHQLRLLKQNDIIKSRRDGKNAIYSLNDEHIMQIFKIGATHVLHSYHEDIHDNEEIL